jgi:signal peptidase II
LHPLREGGGVRSRSWALGAAFFIFIADQLSKWLVTGPLQLQAVRQINVLPIFNLTWTENRGISLGLLTADGETGRWLLVGMTAAIAAGIAWWITHEHQRGDQLALGMVLGGALGNILDRVRFGYVVDFADLHFGTFRPFLVFNVADAAISIGVVILLLRAFLARPKAPEETIDHA